VNKKWCEIKRGATISLCGAEVRAPAEIEFGARRAGVNSNPSNLLYYYSIITRYYSRYCL